MAGIYLFIYLYGGKRSTFILGEQMVMQNVFVLGPWI